MKKLLLSSMVLFSVLATAQTQRTSLTPSTPKVAHNKVVNHPRGNSAIQKTTNSNGSAWFNQIDFLEFVTPGTPAYDIMPVFPDSTIILGFATGNVPVYQYIHKAANYMDPSFMAYQNIITDKFATYTIDSVSVGYLYERNTSNAITDSLIIEIIGENHALDWDLATTIYQDIEFNYPALTLKPSVPKLKRISIPLTINDTCSGGVYKQIKAATSGIAPQTNSKKIGAVVSFKPGYTWNITDTLYGSTKNVFWIISAEQNGDGGGAGTDPTPWGIPSDPTSDMNMSYIMHKSVRYNQNAQGWNGFYLPTYAYTTPFGWESHDIGYRLTVNVTGVKELEEKGFALAQNSPNPFSGASTVDFELAKNATSSVFTITDVTGKVISTEKTPTTAGKHSIKLGSLSNGLYFYSLNVDGKTLTKKMIVE